METTQWWYAEGEEPKEPKGPIEEKELKELLLSRELAGDTPVWREGLEEWTPANRTGLIPPPPPFPSTEVQKENREGPSPARRFWARMVDLAFFTFFTLSPILILLWIPVEAALLAFWGYTPGKWFLGVRLTKKGGQKLDFDTAVHRAFLVWLRGLTLGLYFGWIISCPIAYRKLKRDGITSWDRDLELEVKQEEVPTGRKIFLAILLFFYFFFSVSMIIAIFTATHH